MKRKSFVLIVFYIFFICLFFGNNSNAGSNFKKVLFVNSYHTGYEWSDGILAGVKSVFVDKAVDFETIEMDTKRNTSEEFKVNAALKVKGMIEKFRPDVVITADDNAFKYVVMPFYRDSDLPIVFCGINWDASVYGAPYENTTGMVEVSLVPELINQLRNYSTGKRIGYLAVNNLTAHKEGDYYSNFFSVGLISNYVDFFHEWKDMFVKMQDEVDILIVGNNAGIKRWDSDEAKKIVNENTKIPTGTNYEWMVPYSLLGLIKSANEQGVWAANASIVILNGALPSSIPIAKNKEGVLSLNLLIAEKLNVVFSPSLLRRAIIFDKED